MGPRDTFRAALRWRAGAPDFRGSQSALRCGSWLTRATGSVDDCFGSKTDLSALRLHVCFTLKSRHRQAAPACQFRATSGSVAHSITSSANANNDAGIVRWSNLAVCILIRNDRKIGLLL